MRRAWIVVSRDRHADDTYWVCEERADALHLAEQATEWALAHYKPEPDDLDRKLYEGQIYRCDLEDTFTVWVVPQDIREPGERELGWA